MAAIRPKDEPATTTVAVDDTFLIDGPTNGVRALAASQVPLRDASANVAINNLVEGYATTVTAAGTTTLDVTSKAQQFFTGTTTQTVLLPVTSTLALGQKYFFNNNSTGAVTVQSSGANNALVLGPGTCAEIECIAITGTTAASWDVNYLGSIIASGKVLTVSSSLTLAGTDSTTMTFPTTSATLARTDAANIGSLLTTGTIGYATGAGGAITQLTSRTTGVTLNTPTGAITLFAAAGSPSWQTFTVTNSVVAATDVVHVAVKSGTNTYIATVTAVAAGSFQISFEALVGTASDSPVINFAVIKGVVS